MTEQKSNQDFESYLQTYHNPEGFFEVLERLRKEKGVTAVTIYTKAGHSKSYYYKLGYIKHPNIAKKLVIAFGLALKLPRREMDELLLSANFALSPHSRFDLAVMFCLEQGIYELEEINALVPKQCQNSSVYVRKTGNEEEPEEEEEEDLDKTANLLEILQDLENRLEAFTKADRPFPWEDSEPEDEEDLEVLADSVAEMFEDLAHIIDEATDKISKSM